ncbi:uncharacterized protein VTP21DRAFT_5338 [Calcarisporiella thermophila]|uniref:uncharacterized protein n=1 Tax=Calcarisporiella thermophila TaxID=911321 RepID=UPI003741F054
MVKHVTASEMNPKLPSKEGNSSRKGRSHRQAKNAKNDKDEKREEEAKVNEELRRCYHCVSITPGPKSFTVPTHVCGQSVRVLLDKSVGAPIISQAMVPHFGLSVEPTPQVKALSTFFQQSAVVGKTTVSVLTGSVSLMEAMLTVLVSV